jgi:hypothetical protein
MRIFIFEAVGEVSPSYHCGGGVVIVANDEAHANELADAEEYLQLEKADWEHVITYEIVGDKEAAVFIFPDAGCC